MTEFSEFMIFLEYFLTYHQKSYPFTMNNSYMTHYSEYGLQREPNSEQIYYWTKSVFIIIGTLCI